ncbi:MAG: cobalt ECF transporter T component CbiQ [Candidatus Solincola sediminis]|uniref:Cobalt ECF transporter T component CbiQ n=1 Tax=Candidatus Solincola sediminis TaxID=1797199 RepID=A0A1F2WHM0_9ACTN|nr:MAG: cobalt ECF transporter T component CbiQ [Candidatus Solincola sediminis]OFW61708.1 MAG: cobalt ECF transporter T component CbiQ [Candidatus Solincola sediminis]
MRRIQHAFLDEYSDLDSVIHKLDPRAKLIGFVALVVLCVSTPPNLWLAFAVFLALEMTVLFISHVPLRHVLKRMLIVVPFILAVALFIPFFNKGGGSYNLGPLKVSAHGLTILWNVTIKSMVSVFAVILLSSTTPFPDLLHAMEKLKMPRIITTTLSFTYRYVFVLLDELQRMKRARDSRGWSGKWLWQAKVIGHMIGALFLRSYERGERVYAAMLSRGYDGQVQTAYTYRVGVAEIGFLALIVLVPIAVRLSF